jgi:excisionase family DNA binding protein
MKLYTADEIAKLYQIHPKTVYRLGREGKLKLVRVGRSVRFYEPTEEERMVRDDKREVE